MISLAYVAVIILLTNMVAGTLSGASAQGTPAPIFKPNLDCNFNVCQKQFEANELGIELGKILWRKKLDLSVPEWIVSQNSAVQLLANDENLGFTMKDLVANGAEENVIDRIKNRLTVIGSKENALSFELGAYIVDEMFKSVVVEDKSGSLIGTSESKIVAEWHDTALLINDRLSNIGFDDVAVSTQLESNSDLQKELCALRKNLDAKWKKGEFICASLRDDLRLIINQAYAIEQVKKSAKPTISQSKIGNMSVVAGPRYLTFKINDFAIDTVDITDYQDRRPVDQSDILVGANSLAIRLGRDRDMAMIAGFRANGDIVCAKFLYLPLREGDNIELSYVHEYPPGNAYEIRYGGRIGVALFRPDDFQFLWDPSTTSVPSDWHLSPPVPPLNAVNGRCASVQSAAIKN